MGSFTRSSGSYDLRSVTSRETPWRVRIDAASLCASRRAVPVCEPNRILPPITASAASALPSVAPVAPVPAVPPPFIALAGASGAAVEVNEGSTFGG